MIGSTLPLAWRLLVLQRNSRIAAISRHKKVGQRVSTRRELLRNGTLIASGSVCMRLLSALDRREGEAIQDGGRHWTIGNDLVKRTLSFDSKSGLVTQQFADL